MPTEEELKISFGQMAEARGLTNKVPSYMTNEELKIAYHANPARHDVGEEIRKRFGDKASGFINAEFEYSNEGEEDPYTKFIPTPYTPAGPDVVGDTYFDLALKQVEEQSVAGAGKIERGYETFIRTI